MIAAFDCALANIYDTLTMILTTYTSEGILDRQLSWNCCK